MIRARDLKPGDVINYDGPCRVLDICRDYAGCWYVSAFVEGEDQPLRFHENQPVAVMG